MPTSVHATVSQPIVLHKQDMIEVIQGMISGVAVPAMHTQGGPDLLT